MKLKQGKKTGLKYFTYENIKSWNPCYDPIKYISKDWKGTAIDILNLKDVSFEDKLWVVLRNEICSEKLMRLFAVYCARDALSNVENFDSMSIQAINIAERFALGEATKEEFEAAKFALSAGYYVAWSAAESAAAWSARYAAESAAAVWSSEFARSAARSATQKRYKNKLIEMLLVEAKEKVK